MTAMDAAKYSQCPVAADEEELLERVELAHALDVERVAEPLPPQERLHAARDLGRVDAASGHLAGEGGNRGRQGRELEVSLHLEDVERRHGPGVAHPEDHGPFELGLDRVPEPRTRRGDGHRAHVVHGQGGGAHGQAQDARRGEHDLGGDRLQEHLLTEDLAAAPQEAQVEPAPAGPDEPGLARVPDAPGLAVERVQHHAAPAQVREPVGLDLLRQVHAHHDAGVVEDAPVRPELHPLGEACHHLPEPRAERQGREPDSRQQEEEAAGHEEDPHGRDARQPDEGPRGHGLAQGARAGHGLARDVLEQRDPAQERDEADEREQEPDAERRPRGGDKHEERQEGDRARLLHAPERGELVEHQEEEQPD